MQSTPSPSSHASHVRATMIIIFRIRQCYLRPPMERCDARLRSDTKLIVCRVYRCLARDPGNGSSGSFLCKIVFVVTFNALAQCVLRRRTSTAGMLGNRGRAITIPQLDRFVFFSCSGPPSVSTLLHFPVSPICTFMLQVGARPFQNGEWLA